MQNNYCAEVTILVRSFTVASLQMAQGAVVPIHIPFCNCELWVMQIRVFCRVRPGAESAVTCMPDGLTVRVDGQTEGIKEGAKDCTFAFDKVFGHYSSQADVFAEVSDMVQSALDGYKVLISCCSASHVDKPR